MTIAKTLEILGTVERLSSDMLCRFDNLTQVDWEAPSRCHMWSVKDVGSHMAQAFGFYLNMVTRSIEGNGMPPEGMPDPGIADARSFADRLASRAIQISETDLTTTKALMDRLSDLESRLLDTWRSLSDEQWALPAYHPVNRVSPRGILYWKLLETSIHCWDAVNAVDDSYEVDGGAAALLREVWKNSEINRWFKTPDPEQVNPATLDVDLGDSPGLRIISRSENLEIFDRPEDQSNADAVISADPSLFALLITARADLGTAVQSGRASVAGDQNAVRWFNTWFRGS